MRFSLKKHNPINLSVFLTFIMIYVSNDTLAFGTNSNRNFFWLHVVILLATFVYLVCKTKSISRNMLFFFLSFSAMMLITQIVNLDSDYIKYIYNIFLLALCLFFSNKFQKKDFYSAFVGITCCISLFSIILFVLRLVSAPVIQYFPIVTNESGLQYYYFGLSFLEKISASGIPRMYGIFREPGVFASFIVFGLIIELFLLEQLNIKRVLVLSVAAILTFSTAAYVLMFVALGGYFAKQVFGTTENKHRRYWVLLLLLTAVIILILAIMGVERVINVVFNKLMGSNTSRDSRFGSFSANIRIFLLNPVFGKGWQYVEGNFAYHASLGIYQGTHNTNTLLKILALYGFLPFFFIIFFLFCFFKKESKSVIWGLFITLLWVATLSNEDMSVNFLLYLLPFYGIKNEESKKGTSCENTVN